MKMLKFSLGVIRIRNEFGDKIRSKDEVVWTCAGWIYWANAKQVKWKNIDQLNLCSEGHADYSYGRKE